MSKDWSKEQPEPPEVAPSDWYWYWDETHNEPWIIEVWPGRYIKHYNGLWGPRVGGRPQDPKALQDLKKKQNKRAKEDAPPKRKKRASKTKPKKKEKV